MKTVLGLSLAFLATLTMNAALAQQTTYWFKVESPEAFRSEVWAEFSESVHASTPKQALPASRRKELQKVYEIKAQSDMATVQAKFKSLGTSFYSLERGPEYQPLYNPNDLFLQMGASNYALSLINAPQAWDLTHGDDSVIIAISDQNFNVLHHDLEGKYVHYDASNTQTMSHGTAVAITAAGKTDNGYGLSSIGFNVSLALYKMNFNEVLLASYAGCDIINISWTSGCFYSQIEQDIMDEVADNGSFVIAAAGNGNTCGLPDAQVYPASYRNVFSVTSVGSSDNHEEWIGDPTSTHQHNDSVDLSAPGYGVDVSPAPDWFIQSSGTSYAAAYVSGTAALMLSVNKCLSIKNLETILKNTAAPLDSLNPSYAGKLGAGRLDAYQAVLAAMNTFNPVHPTFTFFDGCLAGDASVALVVQGGQYPYQAEWSNNYVGFHDSSLVAGTYSVHLIDVHGCRIDTTISVIDAVPPTYTTAATNPTCFDASNGSIEITNTSATNISAIWSNGMAGTTVNGLSAGHYTVNIQYGNNCSVTDSMTLVAPPALQVLGQVTNETLPNNGAIDVTVLGGTIPYYYLWSQNTQNEDLTQLSAGTYEVTVQDAMGCTTSAEFTVVNQISAGIEANEEELLVNLYPNPNNGAFTLHLPDAFQVEVFILDAQGRVVYRSSASGQVTMNLDLATGKYLCQVRNTLNGKSVKKAFAVF